MNSTFSKVSEWEEAIEIFKSISGWREADKLITECEQKIKEFKEKEEANRLEQERQAEIARIEAEQKARKRKKLITILLPIVAVFVIITVILNTLIIPSANYKKHLNLKQMVIKSPQQ